MGTNKLGGGIAEQGTSGMGRWVWEGDRFGVNPNLLNGPDPLIQVMLDLLDQVMFYLDEWSNWLRSKQTASHHSGLPPRKGNKCKSSKLK